jgi:hypothetical protein
MKCFKCEKEVNNIYPIIDNFQKVRFGLCPKCIGLLKKNMIIKSQSVSAAGAAKRGER